MFKALWQWWLNRKIRQCESDLVFLRGLENDPERREGAAEMIPLVEAEIASLEGQK